jgi:D-alanyl-D-alanine carboxypeptidase
VTAINLSWAWAVGGIVSTAADVARFGRAVFDGELVSPASFEEMFTYTPDPNPMLAGFGWGMGVWTVPSKDGERVEGGGGGPGFTASMIRLSEADLTVVALMNVGGDVEATVAVPDEAIRATLEPA